MFFTLWARLSYVIKDFSLYLIILIISFVLLIFGSYKIYKSNLGQKKRKVFIAIASTVFSFILAFSLFESYFRYVYDQSDGLGFLKVNARWHARHVVYNSDFFRDRNFETVKNKGTVRIGVLGDSIAFGGGIKDVNNRFSNILEKKLKESGANVEVYNLGTPGYDTEGEIEKYQKVKHLNFDIIIWQYFLNDIQRLGKSTGTPIIAKSSKQGKIVQSISSQSFFFDYLYWRFSQRYNKTFEELRDADLYRYKDQDQLKIHKEEIAAFIKSLQDDRKKVVVIIFPFLYFLESDYPATDVHQLMSTHFQENGVQVVDMLDYLQGKIGRGLWASEFDSHPNEFVHQLAAEKLFEKVAPLIK